MTREKPEKELTILEARAYFIRFILGQLKNRKQLKKELLQIEQRIHDLKFSHMKGR